MSRTYLHHCLKDDHLCRWPDGTMPINVYIAPFTWYEKKKQQESITYRQMVLDSLDTWRKISGGLVNFNIVDNVHQSQIDFKWRRVDRKSLGHCRYEMDPQYRMFSAEIQIGISDGLLHAAYQDAGEVQHTILHEIGHALGLIGHSDGRGDIMYVPHQYGVYSLSTRDIETIQWLYRLPVGFNYKSMAIKYKLPPNFTINDVIQKIEARLNGDEEALEPVGQGGFSPSPKAPDTASPSGPVKDSSLGGSRILHTSSLDEQHQILSEMGRFYLKTQNVGITTDKQKALRKAMMDKRLQNRTNPYEF